MSIVQPDTLAAERRRLPRTPTSLRGKVFPGGVDCLIKDFSKGGARLRFQGAKPAEDRVVVVIWSTGVAVEAVRRWRAGAEAGFQFLHRFDLRRAVPERLADVKREWLGRRDRLRRGELKRCAAMVDYRGSPRAVRLT